MLWFVVVGVLSYVSPDSSECGLYDALLVYCCETGVLAVIAGWYKSSV